VFEGQDFLLWFGLKIRFSGFHGKFAGIINHINPPTLVEWSVPDISTTLFPYSSNEFLKILVVIFQVMKISGQPPQLPHAESVPHQRKSFCITAQPR